MKRRQWLLGLAGVPAMGLSGCAPWTTVPGRAAAPDAASVAALAPGGRLRAAINFGNPILAARGPGGSAPRGVSVDIATEMARRLGATLDVVTFEAAGKVLEAVQQGRVDLAFVAIDPVRGADLLYSAPYVVIEGSYLVRKDSPLQRNEDVDRAGHRVVVGAGSAYDLYLSRELRQASLVRAASSPVVSDAFLAGGYEVAAGVRQQLEADARRLPGTRLLPGRFMVINQAVGVPRGREAGLPWLRDFVEELKATGFVARALARHGIEGAGVAPPRT